MDSPALLRFARPTNGYASVSMVDLAYLGLGDKSVGDNLTGQCPRYDKIDRRLSTAAGRIAATEALRLLQDVSQPNTQWSIVYGLSTWEIIVTMGREYSRTHTFQLDLMD